MSRLDWVIRGGLIVDGTGTAPYQADLGISAGQIAEIAPKISARGSREISAEGHIVTPGWIDIHTHFDGQVTWDDRLDPSFDHGVTTAIMGNCGVGFAPVRPNRQDDLIDIMEGVEDIPGTALHEAMPWGEWESYPEYLAYLRTRKYALDVGSHMSHGALRAYVMGPDDIFAKIANDAQIEQMADLVADGVRAGSMGLSTNRALGHRALSGEPVPGSFASEEELSVLMDAMGKCGAGVLQAMPGGGMGEIPGIGADPTTLDNEIAMMGRLSRRSGRPVTYSLFQLANNSRAWKDMLALSDNENKVGAQLYPQVAPRQVAHLVCLAGYHPLMRRETYLKIRHLPLAERVKEMRRPEIKAAILSDKDIWDPQPGSMENLLCNVLGGPNLGRLYTLGWPVSYEPDVSQSVGGFAKARGESEESVFYDLLLEHDGHNVLLRGMTNYIDGNLDAVCEMFVHPSTVTGLTDAGAHVRFICDASIPTYTLSYFVRDRTRGRRIPLEFAVAKLSAGNADLYGLSDRGRLKQGKRADLNIIDLERLHVDLPRMKYDLPSGSGRFYQAAHGYRATFVNGKMTRENDTDTGERPGRLVSNAVYA